MGHAVVSIVYLMIDEVMHVVSKIVPHVMFYFRREEPS